MEEGFNSRKYDEYLEVGFPKILHEKFETICEENNFTKEEVIRTLIDDFVEKNSSLEKTAISSPDQIEAF